jgi:hypothetical protein
MIRINKYATIQPASVDATETQAQPAATSQAQSEPINNTPTPTVNSANTWQRASLLQDGIALKNNLYNELEQSPYHLKQEVTYAKKESEAKQQEGRVNDLYGQYKELLQNQANEGTTDRMAESFAQNILFGGSNFEAPIMATKISDSAETKLNQTEANRSKQKDLEEEIKRKEAELAELNDKNVFEDVGNFFGFDGGEAELSQTAEVTNSNPLKDLPIEVATKIDDLDDD